MRRKTKALTAAMNFAARTVLTPLENLWLNSMDWAEGSRWSPVFVIGPPRSGTTLLYQLLVNRFNFIYLNNLASRFYMAPMIGLWLSNGIDALASEKSPGYDSRYGKTESVFGPSEAGEFWYRWFPQGDHVYVPPHATDARSIHELRRQVMGISSRFKAPMLFKNTYNSMRVAPIMEAFPEAVFLVSQRDPLDTAQSILEGRMKRNGNKNDWWSVPPKDVEEIKRHAYWEQVVEQVYSIYKQIEEDSRLYGQDRFLSVPYHGLCVDVRESLDRVAHFFKERGVKVFVKGDVPESFPYSTGRKVNETDYDRLRQKVNELWKE